MPESHVFILHRKRIGSRLNKIVNIIKIPLINGIQELIKKIVIILV